MPTTFQKLNLKDQRAIVVLNAPAPFEPELASLQGITIHRTPKAIKGAQFILAFILNQAELDKIASQIAANITADEIIWCAYPKQTSKRYLCDFNRDTGWHILKAAGFDTVRAVAIDEDWSALRFRRIQFIKNNTRR